MESLRPERHPPQLRWNEIGSRRGPGIARHVSAACEPKARGASFAIFHTVSWRPTHPDFRSYFSAPGRERPHVSLQVHTALAVLRTVGALERANSPFLDASGGIQ